MEDTGVTVTSGRLAFLADDGVDLNSLSAAAVKAKMYVLNHVLWIQRLDSTDVLTTPSDASSVSGWDCVDEKL
jgi:hypothetical protein